MELSREELLRFANIFDNAGQVFLGGLVVSPFFLEIKMLFLFVIILLGLILALSCWFISLKITKLTS